MPADVCLQRRASPPVDSAFDFPTSPRASPQDPAINLRPLSDAGRAELLRTGAEQRGLRFGDAMISYILSRCPRDPGALSALLDEIDRTALAEQRQPSIRSIGRLLERLENDRHCHLEERPPTEFSRPDLSQSRTPQRPVRRRLRVRAAISPR
jgi:hypothetical protein